MLKWIGEWVTALFFLLLVVYFWLGPTVLKAPLILIAFIISKFKKKSIIFGKKVRWGEWAYNMFIADDQNANAALGGNRDITVSSRVGYNAKRGNGIALKMEKVINLGFLVFAKQKDHCRVSIEVDEQHNKEWGG
jgi:hypothetical protein